jgi:hypothetical protein
VKTLFGNSLSDTPSIPPCKSKEDSEENIIPEKFDWREKYPECVQEPTSQGNCSSSYAVVATSTVADRIC